MNTEILRINNLSKTYKNNRNIESVLKGIEISFYKNQTVGLLGKNGTGKTTFIKSCLDLIKYNGDITYFGKPLKKMTSNEKVKSFSAVLEGGRNIYWKLTAIENIKYFAAIRGIEYSAIKEHVKYLLSYLSLYDKRNMLVESFSTGMKQKLSLICAFAMNTPVIFLDEPTLGLDLESKKHVIEFITNKEFKKDKIIIITSHDLYFINQVSTNIVLLKDGELLQYNSDENKHYTYDLTFLKSSNTNEFLKSLNTNELYQNGLFVTHRIEANTKTLSEVIRLFEANGIEIKSIENTKHNLENFYLS